MTTIRICIYLFVLTTYGQIGRTVDTDSIKKLHAAVTNHLIQEKYNSAKNASDLAVKYAALLENDSLLAESYRLRASVYVDTKSYNEALLDYKQAITYYQNINNEKGLIQVYNDIGCYYLHQQQHEQATQYLQLSMKLSEKFQKNFSLAEALFNTGRVHFFANEFDKALLHFEKVISYYKANIDNPETVAKLANVHYFTGKTYLNLNNPYSAEAHLEQALSLINKEQDLALLTLIYEELANAYGAQNKTLQELEALENYATLYEALQTKNRDTAFEEILLKYGIEAYEKRLENIENDAEEKEVYIERYKQLTEVLIVILIIIALFTGFFYINQRLRLQTNALLSKRNRELFEAKKQIENVSKIRSNFFSLISHELRTPLYPIIGMTNLLLLEKPEAYQERYLKSLKFSGEHLLAIINNILQMNKIEASKMKTVEEVVELKKTLQNVINSVSFLTKENRNNVTISIDDQIPNLLLGDNLKISQILFNLMDNAVRYTLEGNIRLSVWLLKETQEFAHLKFSVRDDGLGIPQQKKHIIFEKLEQGIVLRENNEYLDLGLGLTTVNNLLKVLKSELYLKSALNKGSDFYFELKLRKIESEEEIQEEEFPQKIYQFENLRVLIVDDNAVNGLLTQKILERQKIATKVVHSGFSALEIIKKEAFDLILMDMFMPKLNGIETIEKIRESHKEVPIILLTAMEISEAYTKILDTDISGVISKPFEPEMLYDKIDEIIKNSYEK